MANSAVKLIDFPSLDKDGLKAFLKLETSKHYIGGILSYASVEFHGKDSITFEVFGDYRKVILRDQKARGTQKAIDTQHANVFTQASIEEIKASVVSYYAAEGADANG
jgi:hypothetical protein